MYKLLIKLLVAASVLFAVPVVTVSGQDIVINEVMGSNSFTVFDEDGDNEDWIEIYNYGQNNLNLEGWGLSDDKNKSYKWVFPDITLGPDEYLLLWASNKNRGDPAGELHTNFAISADGEEIIITSPDGNRVDELVPTPMSSDISIGRAPDDLDNWFFFKEPTPGMANSTAPLQDIMDQPAFSHQPGFYTGPFMLEIEHEDPHADIYYTLDGSEPDEDSELYNSPIEIQSLTEKPNSFSEIQTTNQEGGTRGWNLPNGIVEKANIVRAKASRPGYISSQSTGGTFFVFPDGADRYSLPVVSVISDSAGLFGDENGIYVPGQFGDKSDPNDGNFKQRGIEWERTASVEFFDEDGSVGFRQNAGIRIHGGYSRIFPQKSLRLYARNDYGKQYFSYPIFNQSENENFKRLILRNSGNDWSHSMFMDAAAQSLIRHFNVDTQQYQPSILFLNGEYWGIHNIRERYDKHYLERVYEADPDNIDLLTIRNTVKEGDNVHYLEFISFVENNDLSDDQNMEIVNTFIDLDNFLDYYSAQIYYGNNDWPQKNIDFWRTRKDFDPNTPPGHDGRWRWLLYDVDRSLGYMTRAHFNMVYWVTSEVNSTNEQAWPNLLLRSFLKNEQFKYDFLNRISDHLNTAFHPDRVRAVLDSLRVPVETEIGDHISRWPGPGPYSSWKSKVDDMYTYADERPGYLREHVEGRYDLESVNLTLNTSNPDQGIVKINTVPIETATPGIDANPYPWTGTYFNTVPLTLQAEARDGYSFSHWSGNSSILDQIDINDPLVELSPPGNSSITANFAETEGNPDTDHIIHYWLFTNDLPNNSPLKKVYPKFSATDDAYIEYVPAISPYPPSEGTEGIMDRVNDETELNYFPELNNDISIDDSGMRGIRVRNPSLVGDEESALIFHLPTNGYENPEFIFSAKRTNAGQRKLIIEYSTDNSDDIWTQNELKYSTFEIFDIWQKYTVPFTEIADASDNENFKLRIRFGGDESVRQGNSGNVRFNNILLQKKRNVNNGPNPTDIPHQVELYQNYPNPFNPETKIQFNLPSTQHVTLDIFDITGRSITRLTDDRLSEGEHTYSFDASRLSSGIYIYVLQAGSETHVKRMTFIK